MDTTAGMNSDTGQLACLGNVDCEANEQCLQGECTTLSNNAGTESGMNAGTEAGSSMGMLAGTEQSQGTLVLDPDTIRISFSQAGEQQTRVGSLETSQPPPPFDDDGPDPPDDEAAYPNLYRLAVGLLHAEQARRLEPPILFLHSTVGTATRALLDSAWRRMG